MKFDNSSKFFWFLVASLAFFSIVGTVGLIFGFVASAILTLLYKLSDSFVADAIEEGKRPQRSVLHQELFNHDWASFYDPSDPAKPEYESLDFTDPAKPEYNFWESSCVEH